MHDRPLLCWRFVLDKSYCHGRRYQTLALLVAPTTSGCQPNPLRASHFVNGDSNSNRGITPLYALEGQWQHQGERSTKDSGGRPPSLHCVSCFLPHPLHLCIIGQSTPPPVRGCAQVQSVLGSVTCHQSLTMQGTTSEVQGHSLLPYPQTLCPVECGGAPKTLKSFGKIYAATLQR
jgi:hypothetical protein